MLCIEAHDYTFLCKGTLHGFLVTLKSVNSAIFAF